ncbi:MAG: WG repeat-containing protein [Chryseobacterium sp.]|jgi:hypothetical protein|uniref:WG repeat-containing protein n=1 Tax=Chryseobacterium sp. TaxID=1871047 RepID=UPI0028198CBC|nr:WG repeat-containing protein [Chryseobacterium sp.]MDR2237125.1 WG repeat-containing protein [Chryseobacterium sp.]
MKNIIFLLLSCSVFGQNATLFPAKKGDKWGFVDQNNKLVIAPQYDVAYPFKEYKAYDPQARSYKKVMSARVRLHDQSKCILENHTETDCKKLEDPSEYTDNFTSATETEVKAMQKKASDEKQEIISQLPENIRKQYDSVDLLSRSPLLFMVKKNGKSGIISNTGNVIIPIAYNYIETHRYETTPDHYEFYFIAVSHNNTGPYQYYSKEGKLFLENYQPYSSIHQFGKFAAVTDKKGKKKIYSQVAGKYINDKTYDKLSMFTDGMMLVTREGKDFYIDESGKEYIAR